VGHPLTSTIRTTMAGNGRVTPSNEAIIPEKGMPLIEEGFPDFLPLSPCHHLNGAAKDTTGEHPALQHSAGLQGLQREKKKPLLREERRTNLHLNHSYCHRSQAKKRSTTAHRQIWLKSGELLPA
jgi:hypothetical protein